jgi:hypothetical protein
MLLTLTVLALVVGTVLYLSGTAEISQDIRRAWAPQDIEQLQEELNYRRWWGQLWLMLGAFWMVLLVM